MKYSSLRFFIAVNSFIGWAVVLIGGLFSLVWAIIFASGGGGRGFLLFLMVLLAGGGMSVIAGISIFALGDLYQCFLDIEENTRLDKNVTEKSVSNQGNFRLPSGDYLQPDEPSTPEVFTYMCPACGTFLKSDVLGCSTCGAENQHHPTNKAKQDAAKPLVAAAETILAATQCSRCGTDINETDKFCTSCGGQLT